VLGEFPMVRETLRKRLISDRFCRNEGPFCWMNSVGCSCARGQSRPENSRVDRKVADEQLPRGLFEINIPDLSIWELVS